jgi:uncharacterized protein (DUF1330 family)
MPAYAVLNYRLTNSDAYQPYRAKVRPLILQHGGEILVSDRNSEVIEGSPNPATVVVRFPSKEAARTFYDSDEYQGIIKLRTDNAEGFFVLCDEFAAGG